MIRFARLLPGAKPVGVGINGARRGVVRTDDGEDVTAIVKPCENGFGEIAAEIFVAMLAREVDLPAPEPLLVYDPEVQALLFGSVDMKYPNLTAAFPELTPISSEGGFYALIQKIMAWSKAPLIPAFDEWVANVDRHFGNLLWDGNDFILIDHGRSLGQQLKDVPDANRLLGFFLEVVRDELGQKNLCRDMIRKGTANFDDLAVEGVRSVLSKVPIQQISGYAPDFAGFASHRLFILGELLKARMPYGQQMLMTSP